MSTGAAAVFPTYAVSGFATLYGIYRPPATYTGFTTTISGQARWLLLPNRRTPDTWLLYDMCIVSYDMIRSGTKISTRFLYFALFFLALQQWLLQYIILSNIKMKNRPTSWFVAFS